jgi:hypothetical protein
MELVVLGIGAMALGATLVHLAVEDRKSALAPVAETGKSPLPALISTTQPVPARAMSGHRQEFSKTDVLLADALTELLALKEQVNSLQARVDALTSGQLPSAEAAEVVSARKPLRRRIARSVA